MQVFSVNPERHVHFRRESHVHISQPHLPLCAEPGKAASLWRLMRLAPSVWRHLWREGTLFTFALSPQGAAVTRVASPHPPHVHLSNHQSLWACMHSTSRTFRQSCRNLVNVVILFYCCYRFFYWLWCYSVLNPRCHGIFYLTSRWIMTRVKIVQQPQTCHMWTSMFSGSWSEDSVNQNQDMFF